MTDPLLGTCLTCLNQVPDADLVDGLCPVCREAAAIDAGEPVPDAPSPDYLDRLRAEVQFANRVETKDHAPVTDSSLMYGDLREILSILDPPKVAAPVEPDPSAELLAARLEVERLRESLRRMLIAHVICPNRDCRSFLDTEMGRNLDPDRKPEPHKPGCVFAPLEAPPPDLGPLRELVAAVTASAFSLADPPTRNERRRVVDARRAVLAAFPSLAGEG